MSPETNILIIDSDPTISSKLEQRVKELEFGPCHVAFPDWPIDRLEALSPGLAILGPSLDAETCHQCIHKLKILDGSLPILTSCDDLCLPGGAVNAAFDRIYAMASTYTPDALSQAIESAMQQVAGYKPGLDFPVLIGRCQEMADIRQKIQSVAGKDITVLITGETGTGKELIARAIHFHSPRSKGPLVKINCAAIPEQLLESEVFGFQKGAFTGAYKPKQGQLEIANGGTLFIDEIGAVSLSLQAKFLQILEDKTFSRLGGTEDRDIDVRCVVATNADLRQRVKDGTFRKDLFYRLNIVHLKVPPLRERKADIPLLVHYYLNKYCHELKRKILEVPDHVMDFLLSYHWPGNVRELENVIRRAIVLRGWDFMFSELHLPSAMPEEAYLSRTAPQPHLPHWPDEQMKAFFEKPDFSLKKIAKAYVSSAERDLILKALRETEWNRKKAAKKLGVSYKTLLNRIEEFDLKP